MIEIVSIGTELLTGQTVNTNASVIAKTLLSYGYRVNQITTVSDQHDSLKVAIEEAMERSSLVITTGGLGPTGDDITRHTFAELFKSQLVRDETIVVDLQNRYGSQLETIEDQALVIEGAEIIHNTIGTAPGFILKKGKKTVIALPGVPIQMQEMLNQNVIPYLLRKIARDHFQHALYLFLISEQHVDPYLRSLEREHPNIEIGICPSYGTLSVYLQIKAQSQEEAQHKLAPILTSLRTKFKEYIFSEKHHDIEYAIHEQFIARQLKFACAESCTGGRMASRLTQISGSSNYFLGSLVTYSNEMKTAVLHVSPETLKTHGAVSRETVVEMVQGTLDLSGADYAISVSGIAGPTGDTLEKPIGTIWGAIGHKGGNIFATQFSTKGRQKRSIVIDYSTTYLLAHLWRYIQFDILPFKER